MFRAMLAAEEEEPEQSLLLKAIERQDSVETHKILGCMPVCSLFSLLLDFKSRK